MATIDLVPCWSQQEIGEPPGSNDVLVGDPVVLMYPGVEQTGHSLDFAYDFIDLTSLEQEPLDFQQQFNRSGDPLQELNWLPTRLPATTSQFDFEFYGTLYHQFWLHRGGCMSFSPTKPTSGEILALPLPSVNPVRNEAGHTNLLLTGVNSRSSGGLDPSSSGGQTEILMKIFNPNDPTSRYLILQWQQFCISVLAAPPMVDPTVEETVTFQLKLFDSAYSTPTDWRNSAQLHILQDRVPYLFPRLIGSQDFTQQLSHTETRIDSQEPLESIYQPYSPLQPQFGKKSTWAAVKGDPFVVGNLFRAQTQMNFQRSDASSIAFIPSTQTCQLADGQRTVYYGTAMIPEYATWTAAFTVRNLLEPFTTELTIQDPVQYSIGSVVGVDLLYPPVSGYDFSLAVLQTGAYDSPRPATSDRLTILLANKEQGVRSAPLLQIAMVNAGSGSKMEVTGTRVWQNLDGGDQLSVVLVGQFTGSMQLSLVWFTNPTTIQSISTPTPFVIKATRPSENAKWTAQWQLFRCTDGQVPLQFSAPSNDIQASPEHPWPQGGVIRQMLLLDSESLLISGFFSGKIEASPPSPTLKSFSIQSPLSNQLYLWTAVLRLESLLFVDALNFANQPIWSPTARQVIEGNSSAQGHPAQLPPLTLSLSHRGEPVLTVELSQMTQEPSMFEWNNLGIQWSLNQNLPTENSLYRLPLVCGLVSETGLPSSLDVVEQLQSSGPDQNAFTSVSISPQGMYHISGWNHQQSPTASTSLVDLQSLAVPGPDTTVLAFIDAYFYFTSPEDQHRNIDVQATFPQQEVGSYSQVTLRVQLSRPLDGDFDAFDRRASLSVLLEDSTVIEIARFITPFRQASLLEFDVTAFRPLLIGDVTIRGFIDTFVGPDSPPQFGNGWVMNAEFRMIGGVLKLEPFAVIPVWTQRDVVYGDPSQPFSAAMPPVSIEIPSGDEYVLRTFVTGHGQGNEENCAEFCSKIHTIVAGTEENSMQIFRTDCPSTAPPQQLGTWTYSRAGWCPGARVRAWSFNLLKPLEDESPTTFEYHPEAYINDCRPTATPPCSQQCPFGCQYNSGGHTEPFYWISTSLIVYRASGTTPTPPPPENVPVIMISPSLLQQSFLKPELYYPSLFLEEGQVQSVRNITTTSRGQSVFCIDTIGISGAQGTVQTLLDWYPFLSETRQPLIGYALDPYSPDDLVKPQTIRVKFSRDTIEGLRQSSSAATYDTPLFAAQPLSLTQNWLARQSSHEVSPYNLIFLQPNFLGQSLDSDSLLAI